MNTALEHRGTFWARELEVAGDRRGFATIPGDAAAQLQFALLRRRRLRQKRVTERITGYMSSVAMGLLYSRVHEARTDWGVPWIPDMPRRPRLVLVDGVDELEDENEDEEGSTKSLTRKKGEA